MKRNEKRPPEYEAWANMLRRCDNPNNPGYKNYGGRGIKVCMAWRAWPRFFQDMGPRPSPNHTLERINNDLGYSPENCVWATPAEQSRNKRTNWLLEVDGVTKCARDWCIQFGINYGTFKNRIRRSGLSPALALVMPIQKGWKRSPKAYLVRGGSFNRWKK